MKTLALLAIAGMLGTAPLLADAARDATFEQRECIYDYRMITDQECLAYQARVLNAKSAEELVVLRDNLHTLISTRALERGISPHDWRGLTVAPISSSESSSDGVPAPASGAGLQIAVLIAGLGAVVAIAFFVVQALWPVRNMRLMRCPETGTIAFVGAESVSRGEQTAPTVTVRSCELWPQRAHCARRCLERHEEAASGFRMKIGALRPFQQP